jgi:hypothetical protein
VSRHWRLDDSWIAIEPAPGVEDGLRRSFADEVAIDFPSMREAVARIRLSFGDDDRQPPLVAEIALSPRQAHRGAAVPIDVPLRRTCRACGGRGEVWSEGCDHCLGSGHALERRQVTVSVPAGVADGERFAFTVVHPQGPRTRVEVRVAVE